MAYFIYTVFHKVSLSPNIMLAGLMLVIMGYGIRSWDAFLFYKKKKINNAKYQLKKFTYLSFITPITWNILLISSYSAQESYQVFVVLIFAGVAMSAITHLSYSKVIFWYLNLLFIPFLFKLFYEGITSQFSSDQFICTLFLFVFLLDSAKKIHRNYIGNIDEKIKSQGHVESLQRLTKALDQHSIVSIADKNGIITDVNEKFTQVSQYTRNELIGKSHRIIKSDYHPDGFYNEMWQTIANGKTWHGEIKNQAKDGSYYWVESTIVPQLDEQGKPESYIAMRTDVSRIKYMELEHKTLNKSLLIEVENKRAEKQRFEMLFEKSADGQMLMENGAFTNVNMQAVKLFGYEIKQGLLRSPKDFSPDFQPDGQRSEVKAQKMLEQCLLEGVNRFEWLHRKQDNSEFWADVSLTRLDYQGRKIVHAALRDISQQKQLEIDNDNAKNEAIDANLAKSKFLSSMSHELRTPLNAILGFSQLLLYDEDQPLTVDQKENIELIMQGGSHLLELINDVLDLAQIESGKTDLTLEPILLKKLISDTIELSQPVLHKYSIHISHICSCLQSENLFIFADYLRIKQVLLNLLSNASKYNKENGGISIECHSTSDDKIRITIIDEGNGISLENQKQLFKPFSRLGAENSAIEGSGIGLLVSKELIEKMHGKIGVESEEGKGSSFWFELPISNKGESDSYEEDNNDDISLLTSNTKGLILYVEDNPVNLKLMEALISRTDGLHLISALSAEEGLILAEEEQPDLIIMDINLPVMSGIEAVKQLKKNPKTESIPVLALSAGATVDDLKDSENVGFEEYITKPMDINKVLKSIYDVLNTGE